MQLTIKKIFYYLFLALYFVVVLCYLLVCLVPFISPGKFWYIAVLGLGYPFLLSLLIICTIILVAKKSKWVFLTIAAMLIGWQQLSVFFRMGFAKEFIAQKKESSLRILSWNVSRWTESENSMKEKQGNSFRTPMLEAVKKQNADVICLQEFFQSYAPDYFPDNIQPLQQMGYTYHFFSPSFKIQNGLFQTGLAIFSKYPIIDSVYFQTISGGHSEGFGYADILFHNKTIRIFNTHLESIGLNSQDYNNIKRTESVRSIFSKLRRSYYLRSDQASLLRQEMDRSPYPVIFCGDVDDVPNSYAYFKLKGNLQDAFLKKGFGLGKTVQFISPTLRIDYMMADQRFTIEQFARPDYKYSDHYPQVMDLSLK